MRIIIHRIPKKLLIRKKWLTILGIPASYEISAYTYVCSDHFNTADFHYTPSGVRCLKENALPIIVGLSTDSSVPSGSGVSSKER